LEKIDQILNMVNLKEEWEIKRQKMLNDKIVMTAFLIWFVENYPERSAIMKENAAYQNQFK
jgi:hypothetical protein